MGSEPATTKGGDSVSGALFTFNLLMTSQDAPK